MKFFSKAFTVILTTVIFLIVPCLTASAESYNYDRWGEAVPSQAGYTAERSVTGYDLGVGAFNSPTDIFFAFDGYFYIADSGNNRIVAADGELSRAVKIYDTFTMPDGSRTGLKNPSGVFVSEQTELMYIADTDNSRILIADRDGSVSREITKPDDARYDSEKTFLPQKVIADKVGNVYAVLNNITSGAVMFSPEGEFMGFYGANRVQPTLSVMGDFFADIFRTDAKRARRTRNIPSAITGFDIDGDFIFTCTSTGSTDTVKKLNAAGKNIFAENETVYGDYTPVYDTLQNKLSAPAICDIDISANGYINCLDYTTGRIFQYDEDCNLLFITGEKSDRVGGTRQPTALESDGERLYITDKSKNNINVFKETDFGAAVHKASALHNDGYYEEALEPWLEVLKQDGSYRLAYLGIASAKLRTGEYAEAMEYAKKADSGYIYDRAFEGRRLEFVRKNFGIIVAAIIVTVTAIYLYARHKKKYPKHKNLNEFTSADWTFYAVTHIFEGFEDMRWKKAGSLKIPLTVVILLFISQVAYERMYGFQFYVSYDKIFSIIPCIVKSAVLFLAWCIGSRAVSTFLDGEGTLRNISIYSSVALVPYIVQVFVNTLLSHVLVRDEYVFIVVTETIGIGWSVMLMVAAMKAVHRYSLGRTIFSIFLTIAAMVIMLLLMLLFLSLIQEAVNFLFTLFTEISYRLRV